MFHVLLSLVTMYVHGKKGVPSAKITIGHQRTCGTKLMIVTSESKLISQKVQILPVNRFRYGGHVPAIVSVFVVHVGFARIPP
ncbi:hypothetical protein BU24DRAFT_107641 [Aaosphaeria arxii CBS 175.79]|uniref:Secreted protein n=1 Tax=Aaosphaeria arxii CBS 175.79 TaxID=1450172 RepID=A0A6A5Y133_9PLEO|nr:uncharacterized protein BU24DRAFT_107641 [Aaosphaeria arxii CBS 175.79]KAF2018903.1 hypothetical protein BU24DRAFT_107641 [Aaosphaeria arxii CBS 175.79]